MVQVGVIADSHDYLPVSVVDALRSVDQIWHLGDVVQPFVLEPLQALGKPLHIVRGNNDDYPWPQSLDFTIEGMSCHLIHILPRVIPSGIQLLLHGHTHVPKNNMLGSTRLLNPGSVGRANKGAPASYALLTLENGKATWKVKLVER